ncbi:MAG: GatB/YqeY domain-containing protein [Prevotellaceae bacterium]|jgi:uncharacterized protein YqeY|nr:GatB/YqeY domain-containing protein [Prevotellaceae bacterium]
MSLEQQVASGIKEAMLAKEGKKLEALRAIKAAILLAKTEKSGAADLTPDAEIKLLQKLVKQRRESAEIYAQNGRPELAEKETFEAGVIEAYLPAQLSESEVADEVKKIVAQLGATSAKDMGKVMGLASKNLSGKADSAAIAKAAKALLVG